MKYDRNALTANSRRLAAAAAELDTLVDQIARKHSLQPFELNGWFASSLVARTVHATLDQRFREIAQEQNKKDAEKAGGN